MRQERDPADERSRGTTWRQSTGLLLRAKTPAWSRLATR